MVVLCHLHIGVFIFESVEEWTTLTRFRLAYHTLFEEFVACLFWLCEIPIDLTEVVIREVASVLVDEITEQIRLVLREYAELSVVREKLFLNRLRLVHVLNEHHRIGDEF